jgi:hypothetical protein
MNHHVVLSVFHILFVVPLFLYVAFQRANTSDQVYWFLFALGLFVFLYHGYKAMTRLVAGSSYAWVNLIHVLFIAPLMIYIGYYGKKTPRAAYEILAITAFGALGYHIYNVILQLQVVDEV